MRDETVIEKWIETDLVIKKNKNKTTLHTSQMDTLEVDSFGHFKVGKSYDLSMHSISSTHILLHISKLTGCAVRWGEPGKGQIVD